MKDKTKFNNLDAYSHSRARCFPDKIDQFPRDNASIHSSVVRKKEYLGPVYMEAGLARLARQPGKRDLAV
jgi:hypothetical protein